MTFENMNDFLAFFQDRLTFEDGELPVSGEWANMGNTIGAIALRSSWVISLLRKSMVCSRSRNSTCNYY